MRHVLRRSLMAIILASSLSACRSTWTGRSIPTSPSAPPIAGGGPVRVTLADGRQLILTRTHVVGDSLVGIVESNSQRFATAIADVRAIDERTPPSNASVAATAGKTLLIIAGIVALLIVKVYDDASGG